jgi:hypothetical protein
MTSTKGGEKMMRRAASEVMWVGRATVFVVGLTVIMALVLGITTAAFGANGDFFKVGKSHAALAPEPSNGFGPEERRTVYSVLGLRVDTLPGKSSRVRGASREENLGGKSQKCK